MENLNEMVVDAQWTSGPCAVGVATLEALADKQERKDRYKALREGGCVVQNPDGTLEVLSAEEVTRRLAAMDPQSRLMYESF